MPPSGRISTWSNSTATFLAPMPRKPPLAMTSFWIFPLWASTIASLTLPSGLPSDPWTERPIMSSALTAVPEDGAFMSVVAGVDGSGADGATLAVAAGAVPWSGAGAAAFAAGAAPWSGVVGPALAVASGVAPWSGAGVAA